MKVILNITPVFIQRSGIGNYISNLVSILKHSGSVDLSYILHGRRISQSETDGSIALKSPAARLKTLIKNCGGDLDLLRSLYFRFKEIRIQSDFNCTDCRDEVYHETHYYPFRINRPTISTVYDLSMLLYPELHQKAKILEFKRLSPRILKYSRRIQVISQAVKDEISRTSNYPLDRIDVVYPVISRDFREISRTQSRQVMRGQGITAKYILYTGTLEPRKNLCNLLHAFEILKRRHRWDGNLVLAGARGWHCEDIFHSVGKLGLTKEVIFTGFLAQSLLPHCYNAAEVFVYPSLYEGFGMPCLEAVRCNVKTVVSDIASLREATSGQSVYFDPHDPEDMAEKLLFSLNQPYRQTPYPENSEFSETSIIRSLLKSYQDAGS